MDVGALFQTTGELGLISAIVVLALFLSYSNLGICDLSTDGCFTLGASVGAVVALAGYPNLAVVAAIGSGMLSGLIVGILQTKMGVNSLLAGIIVNTGLYSINIAVMKNSSLVNLNKAETVFTQFKNALGSSVFASQYKIILLLIYLVVIVTLMVLLLKTRLGLAIRATGNNIEMVKSSSISPAMITCITLVLSNGLTALSGSLMAFAQKSSEINIGTGMVTIALASLLIGNVFFHKRGITLNAIGCILGAFIFRLVYQLALLINMPASYLKLVSAAIVVIAISFPYLKSQYKLNYKRIKIKFGGHRNNAKNK